ncbi:MAG: Dyp-type peroxidase [Acidimicrobiales bacterium]|jgi:Dyp-type peroxidase family|nr:Dyp-type peroxidase [Acidimicrobiales bacterium]
MTPELTPRGPAGRALWRAIRTRAGRARPDLGDVQGNVLRPYDNDHAAYLFVELRDPTAGRRLLHDLLADVTPSAPWVVPPVVTTNVALTAAGLGALGLGDEELRTFPAAFRQGAVRRAAFLGDRGPAAPEHWEPGLRDDTTHLLITLTAWRSERLDERVEALHERIAGDDGLHLAHTQRAERSEDRREHFGFLDGIAQPRLAGVDPPGTPAAGTPRRRGWQSLPLGEFVLGHTDAEGIRAPGPLHGWGTNGSYVVVRKLYQDVAAFRSLVSEQGRDHPGGPELLAAKLVGRWPDGTPLTLSPDTPDPCLADDPGRVNDFRFVDDPDGLRCPVGAHIRRANPRDGAGVGGVMTTRHRLLRRGVPYGPRLPEGSADDGVDRGLLFVCFVADIERQFEFVQRRWLVDGDVLGLGSDPDPLLGLPEPGAKCKVPVPGGPPYLVRLERPLVVVRGAAYLFQPGLRALATLASGSTGSR